MLRGQAAARFEGATLAGFGVGFAAAPLLFAALRAGRVLPERRSFYGVSFLDLPVRRRGSRPGGAGGRCRERARRGWTSAGTATLLRTSHVWLLAPTWIAVNASIGAVVQPVDLPVLRAEPEVPRPGPHQGFAPLQISLAAVVVGVLFGAGLLYWGNRFKNLRRTTIILYGISAAAALVAGGLAINHGGGLPLAADRRWRSPSRVRAVRARRRDARGARPARRHLEGFPNDRGAIMGLYSVFLAVGQIIGSLIGGVAADWRGLDGL